MVCISCVTVTAKGQPGLVGLPQLRTENGFTRLWVNGKPFLITGGELGNSSASNLAYMEPIWSKLEQMHLNTVVAPVYWELLEPAEGKFDFRLIDYLVNGARKHHLKLVLLWFGTWKNSMSCYAPAWVKTDELRFPRTANRAGETTEIVTPFSKNALEADKSAFVKLMAYIRQVDSKEHTVLMIQVENEIGMLPEARDHSKPADAAFNSAVPAALMAYLQLHQNTLVPEIAKLWQANGNKAAGTWEEIFGKGPATDELFMAWYFGRYVNEIAQAGKAVYPIPMYLNAALNAPGKKPGEYPSAGPLPHVFDIWKAAAPTINMLSPDFYNPNFSYWADRYTRPDNALFIPEHRFEPGVDAKAFFAFGHYHAIGFSPFSIESTDKPAAEPIGKAYDILEQLSATIGSLSDPLSLQGILLNRDKDTVKLTMGNYLLTVSHDYTLGWSPKAKEADWPLTGGIIIALPNDEFYVAGTGLVVTFKPKAAGLHAGILRADEGRFVNGEWLPGRRMNGDQDHQGRHIRIEAGQYGIQRVKLYNYR